MEIPEAKTVTLQLTYSDFGRLSQLIDRENKTRDRLRAKRLENRENKTFVPRVKPVVWDVVTPSSEHMIIAVTMKDYLRIVGCIERDDANRLRARSRGREVNAVKKQRPTLDKIKIQATNLP